MTCLFLLSVAAPTALLVDAHYGNPLLTVPHEQGVEGSIAVGTGLRHAIDQGGVADGRWNTAVGINALNQSTTGWAQTAIGFNALRDSGTLPGHVNTGVFGNTAIGYNTMPVNDEGYDNTAVGVNTLLNNRSGNDNAAFGINALRDNRTGYDNTGIGFDALMYVEHGYQNVALGGMAGRFYDEIEHKKSGTNSIYIGFQSSGGAIDDSENEIVIGAFAKGKGPNSTVIGSDETKETHIRGSIYAPEISTTVGDDSIPVRVYVNPESGEISFEQRTM